MERDGRALGAIRRLAARRPGDHAGACRDRDRRQFVARHPGVAGQSVAPAAAPRPPRPPPAPAYAGFVRCVPLRVPAMFWYFGATGLLPLAVKEWIYEQDLSMIAGATALIVYSASFVAEDIRSGIRSISGGQI